MQTWEHLLRELMNTYILKHVSYCDVSRLRSSSSSFYNTIDISAANTFLSYETFLTTLYETMDMRSIAYTKALLQWEHARCAICFDYINSFSVPILHFTICIDSELSRQITQCVPESLFFCDERGNTAMHISAGIESDVFEILLNEFKKTDKKSLLFPNKDGDSILHIACACGCMKNMKLILDFDPDCIHYVNAKGIGTCLHTASWFGRTDIARELMQRGGAELVLSQCSSFAFGYTSLMMAATAGHLKICEMTIHYMRDQNSLHELMSKIGFFDQNCLHLSILYCEESISKIFIEHGDSSVMNQKNYNMNTPYELALKLHQTNIAEQIRLKVKA